MSVATGLSSFGLSRERDFINCRRLLLMVVLAWPRVLFSSALSAIYPAVRKMIVAGRMGDAGWGRGRYCRGSFHARPRTSWMRHSF